MMKLSLRLMSIDPVLLGMGPLPHEPLSSPGPVALLLLAIIPRMPTMPTPPKKEAVANVDDVTARDGEDGGNLLASRTLAARWPPHVVRSGSHCDSLASNRCSHTYLLQLVITALLGRYNRPNTLLVQHFKSPAG
jgi:hypothetical protein